MRDERKIYYINCTQRPALEIHSVLLAFGEFKGHCHITGLQLQPLKKHVKLFGFLDNRGRQWDGVKGEDCTIPRFVVGFFFSQASFSRGNCYVLCLPDDDG